MIPIDLWSAEGRAEMRAHLDLIGEIEEAEAKLGTLEAQLPAWLGRRGAEGQTNDTLGPEALARAKAWLDDQDTHEITPAEAEAVTTPLYERPPLPLLGDATEGPIPAPAPATPEEIAAWVEDQTARPAPVEKPAPRSLPTRDIEAIARLHAAGVSPLSISVRLKINPDRVNAVIEGLPAQGAAAESRDPERLWTPELKAEAWAMAEGGFGVEDIAVKLAISDHRVRTLLARIRDGKCHAPKLSIAPAAAPEPPAEATPAEAQAPAAEDQTDPERWIDDSMKAEIWRLDQEGYTAAGIASEMSLAQRRVQSLLYRIKSGKHPVPSDPAASTAITTTSAGGALVVPERGVARDPEMVQQWQDEMAEAERRKFVARSEYPEMQA